MPCSTDQKPPAATVKKYQPESGEIPEATRKAIAKALEEKWQPIRIAVEFGIIEFGVLEIAKEFNIRPPARKRIFPPEKREEVLKEIESNPNRSPTEIGRATNTNYVFVKEIASNAQVELPDGRQMRAARPDKIGNKRSPQKTPPPECTP